MLPQLGSVATMSYDTNTSSALSTLQQHQESLRRLGIGVDATVPPTNVGPSPSLGVRNDDRDGPRRPQGIQENMRASSILSSTRNSCLGSSRSGRVGVLPQQQLPTASVSNHSVSSRLLAAAATDPHTFLALQEFVQQQQIAQQGSQQQRQPTQQVASNHLPQLNPPVARAADDSPNIGQTGPALDIQNLIALQELLKKSNQQGSQQQQEKQRRF